MIRLPLRLIAFLPACAITLAAASFASSGADPGTARPALASTVARYATPAATAVSPFPSIPDEVTYRFRLGIHPATPLSMLRLAVGWDFPAEGSGCVPVGVEKAAGERMESGAMEWSFDFGPGGLRQSQRILSCFFSLWHGEAVWNPQALVLEARDLLGNPVDLDGGLCVDCGQSDPPEGWDAPPPSGYDACGADLCGDVVEDGTWTTSDARAVLGAAVGLSKPGFVTRYDVDRDGRVGATDARKVLRRAVGLQGDLFCAPPPGSRCDLDLSSMAETSTVTFRLDSADAPVGALGFVVEHLPFGSFEGSGPSVECIKAVPTALLASHLEASQRLSIGLVSLEPIEAPVELATCRFTGWPLRASDLHIEVTDASDTNAEPVQATVSATVRHEGE